MDNAHLDLLYRLPYNDLNPDVKAKFESNRFSIEPIPKPPQTLVLANEPTARSVGAFARMRGFGIGSIMREIAIPAATV